MRAFRRTLSLSSASLATRASFRPRASLPAPACGVSDQLCASRWPAACSSLLSPAVIAFAPQGTSEPGAVNKFKAAWGTECKRKGGVAEFGRELYGYTHLTSCIANKGASNEDDLTRQVSSDACAATPTASSCTERSHAPFFSLQVAEALKYEVIIPSEHAKQTGKKY